MKRLVSICLLFCLPLLLIGDKSLFPERVRAEKKARDFFKKNLNRKLAYVKRVESKLNSGNYYTPFIMLSEFATKDKVLIKQLRSFGDDNYDLIEKFRDVRHSINSGNYRKFMKDRKLTPLRFHLLLLHTLLTGYEDNELTGTMASNFWDLVVRQTNNVWCKEGKKRGDMLGVLGLSSRFIFFKRHRKWSRRFSKYIEKLKTGDSDLQYVSLKY